MINETVIYPEYPALDEAHRKLKKVENDRDTYKNALSRIFALFGLLESTWDGKMYPVDQIEAKLVIITSELERLKKAQNWISVTEPPRESIQCMTLGYHPLIPERTWIESDYYYSKYKKFGSQRPSRKILSWTPWQIREE